MYAAEEERDDVARARPRRMRDQFMWDAAKLVFIDETSTNTAMVRLCGRAPCGERAVGHAPLGDRKTLTLVAALRLGEVTAPMVIEDAMNGPLFIRYVEQILAPTLTSRDCVLMDNLPVHKVVGVKEAIEATGATLVYLPSSDPWRKDPR